MVGFGSFFSSLKENFRFKGEAATTTPTEVTQAPYHRPEGVHAAPDGRGKLVALTFDDGPGGAVTSHILDTLREVKGRATFFCLGDRAEEYQGILRRMVAQGCEVASHSHSHERLTRLDGSALRRDLEKAAGALEEFSGAAPKLLRPPYGAVSERMLGRVDMPVVLWSIDSEDWRYCELLCKNRSDAQRQRDLLKVVNSVLDYVQDGDIILMHDLYSFTQDVADTVIAELHHQGWQLVTVSELFAAKGIEPEPGAVYHSAR
jgi:peptidoglycan/xylan/chitin deacetylase (PgdA/CDA1 family)